VVNGLPLLSTGSNICDFDPFELCGTAKSFMPLPRWTSIQSHSFSSSAESTLLNGVAGRLVLSRKMTLRCMLPPLGAAVHSKPISVVNLPGT
jgi:hypothetical protein